ncbi:MAG TPA: efflux RND transporter periplasmic adaptor subunit [Acidobacteriota bacterium]|nr:efflux RND transporter periplasmic adaptor subunit [Acidobacteriota bacterium]
MTLRNYSLLCLSVGAICLAVLSAGCSSSTEADVARPTVAPAPNDPNVFVVDHPEQFPLAAVKTRRLPDQLTVNGVISPDTALTVHVTSLSGGKVIDLRAKLGDDVKKGQVLVVIRSQDLVQAISDYKKFQADELLARHSLERAQLLYSRGAIAQKDLQAAEDAEQKAAVDVQSTEDRIRLLGGDVRELSPIIEVKTPIPGTIVEQNTAGGEGVKSLDNSPSLFTVADLSRVWALCDVYENNLAQVRLGDTAEVALNAYPDHPLRGRIGNISKMLDPNTRTAKVRIELDNSSGLMRPGMFATARFVSLGRRDRMVVPSTALLRLHDRDWVFLMEGDRRYRRAEVQAGTVLPDGASVILAGLQPGEEVVSNALQFSSMVEQQK